MEIELITPDLDNANKISNFANFIKNGSNKQIKKHQSYQLLELHHTAMDFHKQSYYHLKLARIMNNHQQYEPCLILCHAALASMVKALYIQQNGSSYSSLNLSLTELLILIHTDANPGLDIVLFIGTMQYVSTIDEGSNTKPLKPTDVNMLLYKTDDVLCQLSQRFVKHPFEPYQSIFTEDPSDSRT